MDKLKLNTPNLKDIGRPKKSTTTCTSRLSKNGDSYNVGVTLHI